ncbi:uncharacterized protein LOC111391004 isoform X2 [Olea europaea var. sylvestris]|uniref:uncharacterized protein LOC111391004 isoform X2 n=1 Tax=Olea europaea var. sylvestris TaxID=158386 RepID=UPI000C1CE9A4|nr:uncharacterized protein LOC111391004 isoform X2 [Olea europaea var. sylvestris]
MSIVTASCPCRLGQNRDASGSFCSLVMGHLKQLCSIPVRRESDSTCALSTGNPTPLSLLQIVICPFQIQGSWFDCEWIAKLWWLSLNVSLKDFLFLDYGFHGMEEYVQFEGESSGENRCVCSGNSQPDIPIEDLSWVLKDSHNRTRGSGNLIQCYYPQG